jgi:hypothetical protein
VSERRQRKEAGTLSGLPEECGLILTSPLEASGDDFKPADFFPLPAFSSPPLPPRDLAIHSSPFFPHLLHHGNHVYPRTCRLAGAL